ncbi:MAG: LPXTG cell wall anchor domain-containing protein [Ilumatobacteraceae bacterium]|nr:LPXTG cell wall anchor domain-containing protein [Ilumatobacteraceae bacterium]
MTSTRITPSRLGFAAGVALLTTLAIGAPAFAVNEFPPQAVVTATSGCEGDLFYLHTTMSNPAGLSSAHFVLTAAGPATYNGVGIDIAPNDSRVDNWKFFEGVPGFVHITSIDNTPAVDYYFEVTPDCVPEVITTIPATTIPATTIPATTIPATTIPATTIPAPTTTVVAQFVPTALPATGSSSPTTGLLAFGLLGIGILMLRFTRRAS